MKTTLKNGITLYSHDLPDYISKKIVKYKNFYEYELLSSLKNINAFGSGDIIEIGANIGNHVIFYKTQLSDDRKVFAFEPLEDNYKILEKNIDENKIKNVEIMKFGLGKESGFLSFYVNEKNFGNSSLIQQNKSTRETKVEIRNVSESLKKIVKNASFAKVDIEGAEKYIFDDLIKIFSKDDFTFLIELNHYEYDSLELYMAQFEKIRKSGFKLILMPDNTNFLWTTKKLSNDIFPEVEKSIINFYWLTQVRKLRDKFDAELSKEKRELLKNEYKIIAKKINIPIFSKLIWSKFYMLFSLKFFKKNKSN